MFSLQRRQTLLALTALAWGIQPLCAQPSVRAFGGANFPDTIELAGRTLRLNGAGIRYRAMFQVYAAGLYLEQPASTPEAIYQMPGPKRMSCTMLRAVPAQELGNLFTKGILANNSSAQTTQLLPNVALISDVFSRFKSLGAGESFSASQIPGKGMVLTVRGTPQPEPFEEHFFHALLSIWLGPQPADSALKQALLGTDPYTPRQTGNNTS